jgi:hypothetical protein
VTSRIAKPRISKDIRLWSYEKWSHGLGHSQEGLRLGREHIGELEFASSTRQELSTTGITKPRNLRLSRGKVTGACKGCDREREGPVDRVVIRDSSRESEEPLRLMNE